MIIWRSYWNSRLATERQRLVHNIFRNSDVVCKLQPCSFIIIRRLYCLQSLRQTSFVSYFFVNYWSI
jgi:hypothetical protein